MAGHEQDGGFVAQGFGGEMGFGVGVFGFHQQAQDGGFIIDGAGGAGGAMGCDDAFDHGLDAAGGAFGAGAEQARQPVWQAEQGQQVGLADTVLVVGKAFDDLARLGAGQCAAEDGAADDIGGEAGHFFEHGDGLAGGMGGPAIGGLGGGLGHDGGEQIEPVDMDNWRDHPPALGPDRAVADEQAVTEQWFEGVAHLRAFALHCLVLADEGGLHGFG